MYWQSSTKSSDYVKPTTGILNGLLPLNFKINMFKSIKYFFSKYITFVFLFFPTQPLLYARSAWSDFAGLQIGQLTPFLHIKSWNSWKCWTPDGCLKDLICVYPSFWYGLHFFNGDRIENHCCVHVSNPWDTVMWILRSREFKKRSTKSLCYILQIL